MTEQEKVLLHRLVNKVNQHEETIVQLMKIIAATNQRISTQQLEHKEMKQYYS